MRLAASNLSLGSNMGGKNKGLPIFVLKSIINKKLMMLAEFTCPDCPLNVTLNIFFYLLNSNEKQKSFSMTYLKDGRSNKGRWIWPMWWFFLNKKMYNFFPLLRNVWFASSSSTHNMTSAQEAPPPQTVSAALFESVKNYFYVSLKKKTNLLCCGVS